MTSKAICRNTRKLFGNATSPVLHYSRQVQSAGLDHALLLDSNSADELGQNFIEQNMCAARIFEPSATLPV